MDHSFCRLHGMLRQIGRFQWEWDIDGDSTKPCATMSVVVVVILIASFVAMSVLSMCLFDDDTIRVWCSLIERQNQRWSLSLISPNLTLSCSIPLCIDQLAHYRMMGVFGCFHRRYPTWWCSHFQPVIIGEVDSWLFRCRFVVNRMWSITAHGPSAYKTSIRSQSSSLSLHGECTKCIGVFFCSWRVSWMGIWW